MVGAVWYSVEITEFRDSLVELVKKSFGPPGPQLSPVSNGDFVPVRLSELLPHDLFKGYPMERIPCMWKNGKQVPASENFSLIVETSLEIGSSRINANCSQNHGP